MVSEPALEVFYREGGLRNVVYQEAMQAKAKVIELASGDCVYMPMGSPHAVSTGSDIPVTFSILMNTRSSYDQVEAYRVNHVMRKLGLSPTPVGESRLRDSVKVRTLAAARRVRSLAQGRSEEQRLLWY